MSLVETRSGGDQGEQSPWLRTQDVPKQDAGSGTERDFQPIPWMTCFFSIIRHGARWGQMFITDRNLAHGFWCHEDKSDSRSEWGENTMERILLCLTGLARYLTFSQWSYHRPCLRARKESSRRWSCVRRNSGPPDFHSLLVLVHHRVMGNCSATHLGCTRYCSKWLWILIHLILPVTYREILLL